MLGLISIHINKTAGTSFEKILRANYKSVFRINTNDTNKPRRGRSCDGNNLLKEIPSQANVIHGHFKAIEILPLLDTVPIITWVRNPIDRVISNYFYISNNSKQTLLDYATQEQNKNRMSKMLSGILINQFSFIGVKEYFEKDIIKLGKKLNWMNCLVYKLNKTSYDTIDQYTRDTIEKANELDVELYNEVLKWRGYAGANEFVPF
ncbi:hypothetical protein LCGC14_2243480 [marine sediment metagenome]|uniref:Sulfotransferase domain-containing protein n=1 Tax=marine sediment metagenome TaxID=412755 RepID=A0A0F9D4F3_9ZZZZ